MVSAFLIGLDTFFNLNLCCSLQTWVSEVSASAELEVLRDKTFESTFALRVSKSLSQFMNSTIEVLLQIITE